MQCYIKPIINGKPQHLKIKYIYNNTKLLIGLLACKNYIAPAQIVHRFTLILAK
ncbi:hypothetical protein P20495_0534 [Pseudoalteromonas sp. BSi20495]|nr:hypothetical protein P20495_0534 [Pseudoalteromonas sp. BSi20495]